MVRADRPGITGIPEDADHIDKIGFPFIDVHFLKIVQTPFDIAHMDLVDLSFIREIFHNRQELRFGIF